VVATKVVITPPDITALAGLAELEDLHHDGANQGLGFYYQTSNVLFFAAQTKGFEPFYLLLLGN